MTRPDSRRFGPRAGKPPEEPRPEPRPQPRNGAAPAPAPTPKTTRSIPRTTRRVAAESGEEARTQVAEARGETKAQNQLLIIGGVGGGALLLLILIAVAASSGSSGPSPAAAARERRKAAPPPPPPPPSEPARSYNYIRNTGSIVFVCGGTDQHPDREVVLSVCPKCSGKNGFAWDESAYRCSSCKAVYENADIKCDRCGRTPRVTHLKKVASGG